MSGIVKYVGIVVMAAAAYKFLGADSLKLPAVQFVDAQRTTHKFSPDPSKPMLIAPWIRNCSWSKRTLNALEKIAPVSKEKGVDIYAFYLNPVDSKAFVNFSELKATELIHVRAQQRPDLIVTLAKGFMKEAMPGDLFVVTGAGKVEHVKMRELSSAQVDETMHSLVGTALQR